MFLDSEYWVRRQRKGENGVKDKNIKTSKQKFGLFVLDNQIFQLLIIIAHLPAFLITNYAAFWLRFDGDLPSWALDLFLGTSPLLFVIRTMLLLCFRVHHGLWRYASISDLIRIIGGVLISTLIFYSIVVFQMGIPIYPKSILAIDSVLLIVLLGGIRLSYRLYGEFRPIKGKTRILIYGAGDAGEMIVRDIRNSRSYDYDPIGFIDDDFEKVGRRIHGLPVLGTRSELPLVFSNQKIHEVLIAMPSALPVTLRDLVTKLTPYDVAIKTLPNIREIADGSVNVSQIRSLSIEDLLPRTPARLDTTGIDATFSGKRIMVTGAGGSIGTELCRQIADFKPSGMILYERYENNLHAINNELLKCGRVGDIFPLIGDITDEVRVRQVLETYRPQIVFHAAAHKHVPLMQFSPCEAVKNNVKGTRILATAADQYKVERFVMISTDKAVNPTSVMGATKRVAERLVQNMALKSSTRFVIVRFGNVLASNGSVVPHFIEQIRSGGPVTVTHPEVRRYFMLAQEAVQLVLQAAFMAESGRIYALEMGEQVKVVDLARNLIRLSGLVPDKDVPITFTGLRPGEKLSEEIVGSDEVAESSPFSNVQKITSQPGLPPINFMERVRSLENSAYAVNTMKVVEELQKIVPTFVPEFAHGISSSNDHLSVVQPIRN